MNNTQDNRKFILSTQTSQEKLKLACQEALSYNPPVYVGEFTLSDLSHLSSSFSSISSISEAQTVLDNIITNQKVSVELQGDYIVLEMFIKKKMETKNIFHFY